MAESGCGIGLRGVGTRNEVWLSSDLEPDLYVDAIFGTVASCRRRLCRCDREPEQPLPPLDIHRDSRRTLRIPSAHTSLPTSRSRSAPATRGSAVFACGPLLRRPSVRRKSHRRIRIAAHPCNPEAVAEWLPVDAPSAQGFRRSVLVVAGSTGKLARRRGSRSGTRGGAGQSPSRRVVSSVGGPRDGRVRPSHGFH
jgi:hypothetical protein